MKYYCLRILTILLFFVGSVRLGATEYYIDSKSGNDENSGTSIESPWRSLEKVNATDFQPGDSVLFKKDGLWRGTLKPKSGTPENPVLYSAYGEGSKPRFYRSVSLNRSENWISEGNNLWATRTKSTTTSAKTTSDEAIPALTTDVGNIILEADGIKTKAAFKRWDKNSLQNQDDFWFDLDESRLWFRSDRNPAERYSTIEAALRAHVIDLSGCRDAIFDGLDVRYGAAHGFGGSGNERIVIRDCDISWIGGGDQYLQGGAGRRVRFGNGIEFWENARDHLVENNRIWEIYDAAITNQGSQNNRQINVVYRNNEIWNSEYSFEFWNRGPESETRNIVFENNRCRDAGFGWGHIQRPDPNGRHIMFYNNSSQSSDFVIRNNVFQNATESLVRLDNDWTDALTFAGNRYAQDGDQIPYFYWLKKNYLKADFEAFCSENGIERKIRVLFVDRGHPYDEAAFDEMLATFDDELEITRARLPENRGLLKPGLEKSIDVVLFYDMDQTPISDDEKTNFDELLRRGIGVFALHHHLCSHPDWDGYEKFLGGRYLYENQNRLFDGVEYPPSTYSHDETFSVSAASPEHPITQGVADFILTDEAYGDCFVAPGVRPILTTDCPKSTKTVAWLWRYEKSPVFVNLLGHDAKAYNDPNFRKVFIQAIRYLNAEKNRF